MQSLILKYLISLILTRLEEGIDWIKLDKEIDEKIADTFHSKILTETMQAFIDEIFSILHELFSSESVVKSTIGLLVDGKIHEATVSIENTVIKFLKDKK